MINDLQSQIAQAKAAGYSDSDIAAHLSTKPELSEKFKAATDAGYKPEEVIAHLAGQGTQQPKPQTYAEQIATKLKEPSTGVNDAVLKGMGKVGMGLIRGGADVANTLTDAAVNSGEWIKNKLNPQSGVSDIKQWNDQRNADLANADKAMQGNGLLYQGARVGGNVLATLPVGGLLAGGAKAVGAGEGIVNALATGGMRAGAPATAAGGNFMLGATNALTNAATRMGAGALVGGASATAVNPDYGTTGAVIGAATPGVAKLLGMGGNALYQAGKSLIDPLRQGGQDLIKARKVYGLAVDPESAMANLRKVDPNLTLPTAAQASKDPGLAGLEQTISNIVPGKKDALAVLRAQQNSGRTSALDELSGASGARDKLYADLQSKGDELYSKAFKSGDISKAPQEAKDALTAHLDNPYIKDAMPIATKLLKAEGAASTNPTDSVQGLHFLKKALDDKIDTAAMDGVGKIQKRQMIAARDKLLEITDNLSPAYKDARATYSEMAQPVNQMDAVKKLYGSARTGSVDALQDPQLAAATFRRNFQAQREELSKTLTKEQMSKLESLYNDFGSTQWAQTAGKPVKSDTISNMAQGNALTQTLGERIGGSSVMTTTLGNLLKLPYHRANQQILEGVGEATMSPQEMLRLMELVKNNSQLKIPNQLAYPGARAALYQAAPESPNAMRR